MHVALSDALVIYLGVDLCDIRCTRVTHKYETHTSAHNDHRCARMFLTSVRAYVARASVSVAHAYAVIAYMLNGDHIPGAK